MPSSFQGTIFVALQRTAGLDFLDQALGEELGDHLAGRAAGQI
jgi:hypothetical protein